MGFFTDLFRKGDDPLHTFTDRTLGTMQWSKDDEAWMGEFRGRKYGLGYEWKSTPTGELIAYAREVLDDPTWLDATLAEAKQQVLNESAEYFHAEIKSLVWGEIHFYRHKGVRRIIAHLEGGRGYRAWRIEYRDRQCEGIGFDD